MGSRRAMVARPAPTGRRAGDVHEHQADEVARAVAHGARGAPGFAHRGGLLRADQGGPAAPGARRLVRAARGDGDPVPPGVRERIERMLGVELGDVRLHNDRRADALNRMLGARAVTTGREVFFRRGEYDPASAAGQELLAHELTHVAQQDGAPTGAALQLAPKKKRKGNDYEDDDIPGATLKLVRTRANGRYEVYEILETGETFEFSVRSENYYVDDERVDPATLAPKKKPKKKPAPEPKRKKKERSATYDPYYSDMSSSSDDESVELTREEQYDKLTLYGGYKHRALSQVKLPRVPGDATRFLFDAPHARKAYAARRTTEGDLHVDPSVIQSSRIGEQNLSMLAGTGHFLGAGGNKDVRPKGVNEPAGDYDKLFESFKGLGGDKNARELLDLAGDTSKIRNKSLTDRQVSALVLHTMNEPFPTDLARTQLTENLGKLMGIFTSESARAFEAQPPYDASLFIKAGLNQIIGGSETLQSVFYKGTGGSESLFLGAPSHEHSPSHIGGAAQLRSPTKPKHKAAFRRQMALFPRNKRRFKLYVNAMKTGRTTPLPKITKQDEKLAAKKRAKEHTARAGALLQKVQAVRVPAKGSADLLAFSADATSPVAKLRKQALGLVANIGDNQAAKKALVKVFRALNDKQNEVYAVQGLKKHKWTPPDWAPDDD